MNGVVVPTEAVLRVAPAARLRGVLRMPGDKSISHRALILAGLATGHSRIYGAGDGMDVRSTAAIIGALGARVERVERDGREARNVDYRIDSPGALELAASGAPLDCGNSGTSLRLMAGVLAGLPFAATLDGDASLRRRPVARIIEPLRAMGADIAAREHDTLPPVTVVGRNPLKAIDYATPVPSAQVKSAILLAALHADGRTTVHEATGTRDHTERMLRARGVDVVAERDEDGGAVVTIQGGVTVQAIDQRVPGDVSSAVFWLIAGAIHPDAELTLEGVGVNPSRRAVLEILVRMGARIEERPGAGFGVDAAAEGNVVGEPIADLTVSSSHLHGIDLSATDVAAAIDEIPILCLAASVAHGTTTIRGAGELRHKESDRIAGIVAGLSALGARIEVDGDDLTIHGDRRLVGAATDSLDDHRLAMTFAIAGLVAAGGTDVGRPGAAAISYPGFFDDLERVRA